MSIFEFFRKPKSEVPSLPENNELIPEVLPPLVQVAVRRGDRDEVVEIDHVRPFSEIFSHTEIIRPEDEKPMESRIPEYPYYPERGHVLPEVVAHSPVWLTRGAVLERIAVATRTRPEFVETPPVEVRTQSVGSVTQDPFYIHGVRSSKPLDPGELVARFQKNGFPFVRTQTGEIGMLVNATVPLSQNTDGTYRKGGTTKLESSQGSVRLTGITSESTVGTSFGILPATKESSHALFISMQELIDASRRVVPLETRVFGGPLHSDSLDYPDAKRTLLVFFKRLLKEGDEETQQTLRKIISIQEDTSLSKKRLLFRFLEQFSSTMILAGDGRYPYEPIYHFYFYHGEVLYSQGGYYSQKFTEQPFQKEEGARTRSMELSEIFYILSTELRNQMRDDETSPRT